MSVMGTLAPKPTLGNSEAERRQRVRDRLTYWGEHLREHLAGNAHPVLTLSEVRRALDRNLDDLLELDPHLKPCILPDDETVWTCTVCGADVAGVEPVSATGGTPDPVHAERSA